MINDSIQHRRDQIKKNISDTFEKGGPGSGRKSGSAANRIDESHPNELAKEQSDQVRDADKLVEYKVKLSNLTEEREQLKKEDARISNIDGIKSTKNKIRLNKIAKDVRNIKENITFINNKYKK